LKEQLRLLMDLQKIDDRFRELEISKGTLPMELKRIEKEFADLKQRRSGAETSRRELQVEISRREKAGEELKQKINALQERLFGTQTNQEYEAVTREIDWHQESLSENDTRLAQALETQTEVEQELETSASQVVELGKRLEDMKARYAEFNTRTAAQAAELQKERDQAASQVKPRLLAHYERILKAKDGRGVVAINRGTSCGGCFHTLPPQTVTRVRAMNDLMLCETCGRVLVSDQLLIND
jgi:predicted  nucleic acid-binding Zn-ribbon protein